MLPQHGSKIGPCLVHLQHTRAKSGPWTISNLISLNEDKTKYFVQSIIYSPASLGHARSEVSMAEPDF